MNKEQIEKCNWKEYHQQFLNTEDGKAMAKLAKQQLERGGFQVKIETPLYVASYIKLYYREESTKHVPENRVLGKKFS